jgi:broad specificity phosphatase PhoE
VWRGPPCRPVQFAKGAFRTMTHLYLIRHAQADGLQPGVVGSSTPDSGLSPLGIIQTERLRERLAATGEIRADVLISSPLQRARQTAERIAPALGLPVLLDDGVQELNLGACEGLTPEEIGERPEPQWCLLQFNDYAHLLDLDTEQRISWEALAVKRSVP